MLSFPYQQGKKMSSTEFAEKPQALGLIMMY